MKILDITLKISEDMLVYPGDPSPKIEKYCSIGEDGFNESKITLGSHTGTHIDAPYHVKEDGKTLADISLDNFYGKCKVLDLISAGNEIRKEDLTSFKIQAQDIILLKTINSQNQYERFRKNYAHLKYDAAAYLVEKQVKTVGVDYLSVEKFNGGEGVHELLLDKVTLIEGLYLKDVEPGEYIFLGLPLNIDGDGAPIRAVLIKN